MSCGIPRISLCGAFHALMDMIHDAAYARRGALKADEYELCAEAFKKWADGGRRPGPGFFLSSTLMDRTYARCTGGKLELIRQGRKVVLISDTQQFEDARKALQIARPVREATVTRLTRPAERLMLPKPEGQVVELTRIGMEKAKVLRRAK